MIRLLRIGKKIPCPDLLSCEVSPASRAEVSAVLLEASTLLSSLTKRLLSSPDTIIPRPGNISIKMRSMEKNIGFLAWMSQSIECEAIKKILFSKILVVILLY